MKWQRLSEFEFENAQHRSLGCANLRCRVRVVGDKNEISQFGRVDLLVFRSDEHGSDADELKTIPGNGLNLKKTDRSRKVTENELLGKKDYGLTTRQSELTAR